jgi:hypothetical protein
MWPNPFLSNLMYNFLRGKKVAQHMGYFCNFQEIVHPKFANLVTLTRMLKENK